MEKSELKLWKKIIEFLKNKTNIKTTLISNNFLLLILILLYIRSK